MLDDYLFRHRREFSLKGSNHSRNIELKRLHLFHNSLSILQVLKGIILFFFLTINIPVLVVVLNHHIVPLQIVQKRLIDVGKLLLFLQLIVVA